MKNLFKPFSFLLYILVIICFFFVGLSYAGLVGAGKNQGLAAGAIVIGYGLITAFIAFIAALIFACYAQPKIIIITNKILGLLVLSFMAYFTWNYYANVKPKREQQQQDLRKPTPTTPATKPIAMLYPDPTENADIHTMGLGLFTPVLADIPSLYLYTELNLEKSLREHSPTDSLTFVKSKYGFYDITTAPPYLLPEHLKLDYDILLFKVLTVTEDFLEIEVNKLTGQTTYVAKNSGDFTPWSEFLLRVNSVEFLESNSQKVHIKPQPQASTVNFPYSFMRPLKIGKDWMYVQLITNQYEVSGKGWIKWHDNGQWLIRYSLLS